MKDWTQDPQVVVAIHNFDVARAAWLRVAPADGILRADAPVEQDIAFARMRATDRAYLWARDSAIERSMWGAGFGEPTESHDARGDVRLVALPGR